MGLAPPDQSCICLLKCYYEQGIKACVNLFSHLISVPEIPFSLDGASANKIYPDEVGSEANEEDTYCTTGFIADSSVNMRDDHFLNNIDLDGNDIDDNFHDNDNDDINANNSSGINDYDIDNDSFADDIVDDDIDDINLNDMLYTLQYFCSFLQHAS